MAVESQPGPWVALPNFLMTFFYSFPPKNVYPNILNDLFSHLPLNFYKFPQFLLLLHLLHCPGPLSHNQALPDFLKMYTFFYFYTYFTTPGPSHTTGPRGSIPL